MLARYGASGAGHRAARILAEIQIESGMLVLTGERKMDSAVPSDRFLRIERPYGRFSAQVSLPPSVDPHAIRAAHRNGVIEIVLPKRKETPPSRIEVSSGLL